jgi:allantoin racemase
MKILVVNANTSPQVTELVAREARHAASPGTEIVAATGAFGARVISTRAENAIGQHALVDLVAANHHGCDAVLIGVSHDTGLAAAREMLAIPVVGMTEAALHTACFLGGRFGMIVFGRRSLPGYRELVASYGLATRLGGLRSIEIDPATLYSDPASAETRLVDCAKAMVDQDEVDVVIACGAAMAGIPRRIQDRVPVPVVDGVNCGTRLAELLARMKFPKPSAGSYAALPRKELVNVSPAIAKLFEG